MFKHDFVYSVYEDFIDVDKKIKNKINKIKVTKFNEHRNSFNVENKINPLLLDIYVWVVLSFLICIDSLFHY